jgi:hypothetical protein
LEEFFEIDEKVPEATGDAYYGISFATRNAEGKDAWGYMVATQVKSLENSRKGWFLARFQRAITLSLNTTDRSKRSADFMSISMENTAKAESTNYFMQNLWNVTTIDSRRL